MAKEIQIKGFICEKCGKVYSYLDSATNERMANNCCMQYHCQDCGVETPKYQTLRDNCDEIRKFNNAKKPIAITKIARTKAKIGRKIKNFESIRLDSVSDKYKGVMSL